MALSGLFSPGASGSSGMAMSRASARRCSNTPISAIISAATSRRWCIPQPPSPSTRTACGRWPAPPRLAQVRRIWSPARQQVEWPASQDISANDCFKPVSRYWDRINRSDQLLTALPEAMRVLTDPAETGAVTLALPQDVQTEAYRYPTELFRRRVWHVPRNRPDRGTLEAAAQQIRA